MLVKVSLVVGALALTALPAQAACVHYRGGYNCTMPDDPQVTAPRTGSSRGTTFYGNGTMEQRLGNGLTLRQRWPGDQRGEVGIILGDDDDD